MISRKFAAGTTIYHRGETARSAFEVREGQVRLTLTGPDGRELSAVLGVGQVFGAAEMISGDPRQATAKALGDIVLSEIGRDELARLFADGTALGKAMLLPAFERLRREAEPIETPAEDPAPRPSDVVGTTELRLKPAARELAQQMDADGIRITRLPFLVGRRSFPFLGEDESTRVDLVLDDSRPYSLSRRHFAIEMHDGAYVVRDCGSRLGTIVNGARIGGKLPISVAPVVAGENQIVAGRSLSPFRFVLTMPRA
jgi:CRP-like cAMP-binding protein